MLRKPEVGNSPNKQSLSQVTKMAEQKSEDPFTSATEMPSAIFDSEKLLILDFTICRSSLLPHAILKQSPIT